MAGGGDNGVLLGMTAAQRAQRGGRGSQGVGSMFNVFPKMIIPVVIYAIVALIFGGGDAANFIGEVCRHGGEACTVGELGATLFVVPMVSGLWGLSVGDVLVILGLIFLFIELVKSAGSGTATIINHALSMLVFVLALGLFLLVELFATSTFFLIMMMTLMDTLAGFIVTIVAARRDLAVGGDG